MSDQEAAIGEETLAFGSFKLYRSQRVLVAEGSQVRIGGRALDILIALVERGGEVVTKRQLMGIAWPHSFVEESNLRVHIAALRKLLGEGQGGQRFIGNVAGRGYIFTAPVTRSAAMSPPPAEVPTAKGLPEAPRLVGRDSIVSELTTHLHARRFVTIVGPAGVGKSALAITISQRFASSRRVCFVDLTAVERPELLPAAIASVLDVSVLTSNPLANLLTFLRGQSVTIVLDNCEHLVGPLAELTERFLQEAPQIAIIATSREPLRSSSEFVFRLTALASPPQAAALTAEKALDYPAVQLFVERATSSSDTFDFSDRDAAPVAEICRRLDGLPLAIELIAARVDLFGVGALATSLGERLMLSASGNRNATRRSRSIREALDWSYDLLSLPEKTVLRRFSAFKGPFSLESATAVASNAAMEVPAVLDALASLSSKSLIVVDTSRPLTLYRLLHVTRTYAAEKAAEEGETAIMARLHCHHFCVLLSNAEREWETLSRRDWLDAYGHAIEDVRTALDWGFSDEGDRRVAAALMVAALPYGFQLCLLDEFRKRAESALAIINASADPISALRLTGALCSLDLNASIDNGKLADAFERMRHLCDQITDARFKIEPLLARAVFHIENGDHDEALSSVAALAAEAREQDDPLAMLATDRIWAQAQHFAGRHPEARALAERVIRHPAKVIPLVYSQTTIDRQITMRIVIARSYWLEGRTDDARGLMHESMDMAAREGPIPTTFALAMGGCLMSLWLGDLDDARERTETLLAISGRYTLERWERLGEGYAAALRQLDGQMSVNNGLDLSFPAPVSPMHRMFLATAGLNLLDADLIAKAEAGACGWCQPEILRLAAVRAFHTGLPEEHSISWLLRAIEDARDQGALSWELRAATSLAEVYLRIGRSVDARDALEQICSKMKWGHTTADYRRAETVLGSIA